MDIPGARHRLRGAQDDVTPWVAGSQIAWDLVHTGQGTAARRLHAPYLLRQQDNNDDDDGNGNGEPQADPISTLREWLESLDQMPEAPPIITSAVVAVDDIPAYGVDAYRGGRFGAVPASSEAIAALRETSTGEVRERGCAVCLHDFEAGDALRRMPCSHTFHQRCIFDWLRVSGVCPLCRHRLPKEEGQ